MNEKEKVLQLAREKYKDFKNFKYKRIVKHIKNDQGFFLLEALLDSRLSSIITWSDLRCYLSKNFGLVCKHTKRYSDEIICKMFLENFKLEQKTMKNE